MGRLRGGTADLLVATDVAARGLDIEQLTHVVNYNVPSAPEAYTHRIGRVGRAGREGVAITLVEPRENSMLKTIERVSKTKIPMEKVPTVADLRARQLELTRSSLQESLMEDDLSRFRVVVETLADEFDVMDIALAAVKLAHEASGAAADEEEIPEVRPREDRPRRDGAPAGPRRERRGPSEGMTRLFLGAGRSSGIRPQDIVGAITGETSVKGRDIGAIEIADRFSLVEVPGAVANDVIEQLRDATIKGKRVTIRRERQPADPTHSGPFRFRRKGPLS